MNPIVYAIPVFLLTMIIEFVAGLMMKRKIYDLPDTVTSLHLGVLSQLAGTATRLLSFGIYVAVYTHYRATTWATDNLWLWALALAIYDLCYYWNHRLDHEVGVLWAAHVVHHSSEYYNLSTALRQTSTGALLGWIFYIPMAVMGVPPVMFATVALIDLLYQYWVHTELVGRLGWLDYIFVTPSNHRVHHGQNDYCIDRNYGGILIVWDHLFRSFEDERRDEPVCYGIRKPLQSFNPVWGNLHFYADLWRDMTAAKGLVAKVGVLAAPPGGWDSRPREANFPPRAFHRYAPGVATGVRVYVLFQYVVTNVALTLFLMNLNRLSAAEAWGAGLFIMASMVAHGGLLEGHLWAKRAEQGRLLLCATAVLLAPSLIGLAQPMPLRIAVATGFLACLAWLSPQGLAPTPGSRPVAA